MIRRKHCKTRRSARLHLRAPLAVLALLAFALVWDGNGILRMGLLCAFLHESGHLVMFHLLRGYWPDLQISPFGLCLLLRGAPLRAEQELLLAAAGPLVNLLLCCGILWWMQCTGCYRYAGYWFACTNLLVGGANLLPLPGLDGERIFRALFQ